MPIGSYMIPRDENAGSCSGKPFDRRTYTLSLLRPNKSQIELSWLIGQPKLSLEHLFHVFLWLIIGYLISFVAFLFELIWFQCEQKSEDQCHKKIQNRKISRMEASRKKSKMEDIGLAPAMILYGVASMSKKQTKTRHKTH